MDFGVSFKSTGTASLFSGGAAAPAFWAKSTLCSCGLGLLQVIGSQVDHNVPLDTCLPGHLSHVLSAHGSGGLKPFGADTVLSFPFVGPACLCSYSHPTPIPRKPRRGGFSVSQMSAAFPMCLFLTSSLQHLLSLCFEISVRLSWLVTDAISVRLSQLVTGSESQLPLLILLRSALAQLVGLHKRHQGRGCSRA